MQLCAWLTYHERVIYMPMRMRNELKDKALHVLCEGWVSADFGVALFEDVCTDVAALAIQKEEGEAALRLFDPYAPPRDVFAGDWPEGACITLYSNHYQHSMEPTNDDLRNLAALPEGTALYIIRESHCKKWTASR